MFTFKHRRTHAAKGRACIHAPPKKKTSQQIADENVIMPFEEEIVKMHVEGYTQTPGCHVCGMSTSLAN
jgi:hypothetical protein